MSVRSSSTGGAAGRRRARPTRAAWRLALVALGLLGAAVNTGNNLSYLMFSLVMAGFPVSFIAGRLNLRRLRCELKLPRAPIAGSPLTIDAEISVGRGWPAGRSLEVTVLTDRCTVGPVLVERIESGRTARVALTSPDARRGPLKISGVRIRSRFPFGFMSHERHFDCSDELLVLPSAGRRSRRRRDRASFEAGAGRLSTRVAGCEYAGLRQGRAQDDARRVDWKVTARRGVTIVRETVGESRGDVRLDIATVRDGDPEQARRRFERDVSRLAGVARGAIDAGAVVHLTVNGADPKTYVHRGAIVRLLRRLARLVPTTRAGDPLPQVCSRPDAAGADVRSNELRASGPGRALRWSATAALAVGAVALFMSDGIGPLLFGLVLASTLSVPFDRFVARERSFMNRLWQATAVLALIGYLLDLLVLRRDPLAASLALTVFITLFTVFNARRTVDDRRLLLVSFLLIVLSAALTTEIAIALPLVCWLLAITHGLVAGSALPEPRATERSRMLVDAGGGRVRYAGPALGMCAAVVVSCLVIFLTVPHFGTGAFRPGAFRSQRVTGFSDKTTLGDIGRIKLDQAKVMEAQIAGAPGGDDNLRWRGLALNEFDGRTWSRSYTPIARLIADDAGKFFPGPGLGPFPSDPTGARSQKLIQAIRLEPGAAAAVFAAGTPRSIASRDFRLLGEDHLGNLELVGKPSRRLSYVVTSDARIRDAEQLRRSTGADPEHVRALNLALPSLDPRIASLANDITSGAATRYDAATALEQWLSASLTYSLEVDDHGAADPLSRFLFDGMAGHCEYFATAMVVMARQAGIPSRFVAGYLRGEKSRFGHSYLVRQSDAHSWVEVYFPGVGWIEFDPTPPQGRTVAETKGLLAFVTFVQSHATRLWDDYLVGIDLDDQVRGFLGLTAVVNRLSKRLETAWTGVAGAHPQRLVFLAAALAVLLWTVRSFVRWLRRRSGADDPPVPSFYAGVLGLLSKRGLSRRPGETPAELVRRADDLMTRHARERLLELTRLYYRVRFDGTTSERDVSRLARALIGDVRNGLRN